MAMGVGVSLGENIVKRSKYGKVNREFFDKHKVTRTSKRAKVKRYAGTGAGFKRAPGIPGNEREMVVDRAKLEKKRNYNFKTKEMRGGTGFWGILSG